MFDIPLPGILDRTNEASDTYYDVTGALAMFEFPRPDLIDAIFRVRKWRATLEHPNLLLDEDTNTYSLIWVSRDDVFLPKTSVSGPEITTEYEWLKEICWMASTSRPGISGVSAFWFLDHLTSMGGPSFHLSTSRPNADVASPQVTLRDDRSSGGFDLGWGLSEGVWASVVTSGQIDAGYSNPLRSGYKAKVELLGRTIEVPVYGACASAFVSALGVGAFPRNVLIRAEEYWTYGGIYSSTTGFPV